MNEPHSAAPIVGDGIVDVIATKEDTMPINLQELLLADAAEAVGRRRDDTQLATDRQRDGAAQDTRVIGGMIAKELLVSDSPDDMSRLNAATRIPTTIDHPSIPVTK